MPHEAMPCVFTRALKTGRKAATQPDLPFAARGVIAKLTTNDLTGANVVGAIARDRSRALTSG